MHIYIHILYNLKRTNIILCYHDLENLRPLIQCTYLPTYITSNILIVLKSSKEDTITSIREKTDKKARRLDFGDFLKLSQW